MDTSDSFENKLLAITATETNRYINQFHQEPTKKQKDCKDMLWSMANGRTLFIDTTNMTVALALPEDYHTNVSYHNSTQYCEHNVNHEISQLIFLMVLNIKRYFIYIYSKFH